ncbi:1496_t:CDS:2 [Funneliformis mosseae]|uniref:1496_t:CDS:1 n=1 Tax=Funneliformis mosseae TaxID=27381 RepID=A0A9N9CPU9_FUNMO|nr:1496_t:CDS:2 [Funneliformis mosseae]
MENLAFTTNEDAYENAKSSSFIRVNENSDNSLLGANKKKNRLYQRKQPIADSFNKLP